MLKLEKGLFLFFVKQGEVYYFTMSREEY